MVTCALAGNVSREATETSGNIFPESMRHIRPRVVPFQLPQRAEFRSAQWVCASDAILQSVDVQKSLLEVDLVPSQGDELGYPQPMAIGNQEQRCIAVAVSPHGSSRPHQGVDFRWREVLP